MGCIQSCIPRDHGQGHRGRSVKTRSCYLAVGVTRERELLGLWWQDTEGAKFWLAVLNDLHQPGVAGVLIACVDYRLLPMRQA